MVKTAIKQSEASKARCLNNISYAHQNHLGPTALSVSDRHFQSFTENLRIPAIWMLVTIISILKLGKDSKRAASYCPIFLLSKISKVLEREIYTRPKFQPFPKWIHIAPPDSLLTNLSQKILEGLNNNKPAPRSIVSTKDISKALDTVPIPNLISEILATNLHPNYKKRLSNFITDRQAHEE